jgi:DnaJ-class molecular chaperone
MDPYRELGVARSASADEIRKAYRKLAKELHPDARPNDKVAEERFKRVTASYEVLGDATKRARFDRGETDVFGQERGFAQGRSNPGGDPRSAGGIGPDDVDLNDILNGMFGGRGFDGFGARSQGPFKARGADIRYTLPLEFLEAARGGEKRVTMGDGRTLNLRIPPGVKSGQVLRLRGQGRGGMNGPAGDALVEVDVKGHRYFERDGDNLVVELPITLQEAVLGAKVEVPTLDGMVTMTVPKATSSGAQLRLRGKGFPTKGGRGDQIARVRVLIPESDDAELEKFMKGWKPKRPQAPRSW